MEKQVVSKERVADHGEVLTGKREVRAMLDLVRQETERALAVFEDYKIRRQYDEQAEKWVFSVVDVVAALKQPDF